MLLHYLHFFSTRLVATSHDYLRIIEHFGNSFFLLANAADGEFSTSSPALSVRFLDILETRIATSVKYFDFSKVIEEAVTSWRIEFPDAALWVTCVCVGPDAVNVFWASGDEIWIKKSGIASRKTVRHTLGQRCLPVPDILVNGFGPEYKNGTLESAEFIFNPAIESVVILGWKVLGHTEKSVIADQLVHQTLPGYLQQAVSDSVEFGSPFGLALIVGGPKKAQKESTKGENIKGIFPVIFP